MLLRAKRQPSRYERRLLRLNEAELVLQADALLFTIGRAIRGLQLDDLRSAQNELKALQAVVDILLERKGN